MKKSSKILVGIGSGIIFLLVIALVLPFLIDLNQFKPQIQKVVADAVNARLDFKSARLRILPGLGVVLQGVVIENSDQDFNGTKLFAVDEVFFQTELGPLFTGKFVGNVRIDKPEIVMARRGFKNNLTSLSKPGQPEAPKPVTTEPADPKAQAALMQTIKDSVLIESFIINDASLKIVNLGATTSTPVSITDLDLEVTNIGLDRDILIKLSTEMAVAEAGINVKGPISMLITNRVTMGGEGFDKATFDGKLSFDELEINAMNAFVKPRAIPLNVAFKGAATKTSLLVEDLQARLHNLAIGAKVNVKDLATLLTTASVTVKNDDLAKLGDVLPQHKSMLINGSLDLQASLDGPLADLKGVTGALDLKSKLTGSDLAVNAQLNSMSPLKMNAEVVSQRLDLGAILKPFMPADAGKTTPEKKAETPVASDKAEKSGEAPEKDFELTPEQKTMLAGADAHLKVTMKEFLFDPIKLENFLLDVRQNGLRSQLDQFAVDGFGGQVRAKGLVNLEPSPIAFEQDFQVNGVKAEEFIALIKPEHKDLLKGALTLQLAAKGQGTTRTTLSKTLNGKGHFVLENGELHTPSVAGAMQTEFDKYVGGLSIVAAADKTFAQVEKLAANPLLAKIPGGKGQAFDVNKFKAQYGTLKNVNIAEKASVDKGMKKVEGEIEIKDGRIFITSKTPLASGLFDFNGSVGLDMTLAGGATFIGSDALKEKMLSQSQYAGLLFDDKKNFNLGMNLSGLVTDPKVALNIDALKNSFNGKAQALVEAEVKKAADEYLKKNLGGSKAALLDSLKQKQADLKNKAKDDAKKQAEAEAKKQGEDKAKGKAKDKLKGLFGG